MNASARAADLHTPGGARRLVLAVLIPLAAFGLQSAFWAAIQPYVWFLFYPAVFFSSWVGGLRGGLVATSLSDNQGRFVEFNEAFATFHEFKNKEECAKTLPEYPAFLEVFLPGGELVPLSRSAMPWALRGETVTNAEYTLRRKDTDETWVGIYSFGPIRDQAGATVGSVVAGRDITESKRTAMALRASEARRNLALDAARAGSWEWEIETGRNIWSEELKAARIAAWADRLIPKSRLRDELPDAITQLFPDRIGETEAERP